MKNLLKTSRENKKLLIKDVANLMGIDQALVSKWEKGTRKPTRDQILKLAQVLDIDTEKLLVEWMSEIILYEIGNDELAIQAMQLAESKAEYIKVPNFSKVAHSVTPILNEIDKLKNQLNKLRHLDSYRIAQALELEYTFESNRIEGNTLTLKETDLVINEGITISGKSMREHLEAINHKEAVEYLKHLINRKN